MVHYLTRCGKCSKGTAVISEACSQSLLLPVKFMADWSDFETLRNQVRYNTVDRLKHIVVGINEQCGTHMTKGGKKQDLIDRIIDKMDTWRQTNAIDKWTRLRPILMHVRENNYCYRDGSSTPYTPTSQSFQRPQSLNAYAGSGNYAKLSGQYDPYSANNIHRPTGIYDPYAPSRKVPPQSSPNPNPVKFPSIRFKPSPFFKFDTQISSVVECPESASSTDRRSQSLVFSLSTEVSQKLRSENPKYQLRLYCTSSQFYNHGPHIFRTQTSPCPIEFPPTCEVRFNNHAISANLKGMKKKPGTAPPAELPNKSLQLDHAEANQRIDMIYVNSQQPVQVKKYYMSVFLVEVTTSTQLVERLKSGKRLSEEVVRQKMKASALEDEDVIVGEIKISLKCPLTYMRIKTPCRSSQCSHPQCFDALSWYQLMEQTTTWLCPVCEKVIQPEDLVLDGYFESILSQITDDDIENVLIEPSGEWHTADNKFGSRSRGEEFTALVREITLGSSTAETSGREQSAPFDIVSEEDKRVNEAKQAGQQVFSLCDSDEEDESVVTRELSRITSPQRSSVSTGDTSGSAAPAPVIDLTLDSDEEGIVPIITSRHALSSISHQTGVEKRKRTPEDHGGPNIERRMHTSLGREAPDHSRMIAENRGAAYGSETRQIGSRYDPRLDFNQLPNDADYLQQLHQQQELSVRHQSLQQQQIVGPFASAGSNGVLYRTATGPEPRATVPIGSSYLTSRYE